MKKALYFFAAITMAASSAMASKARVSALSSTPAINDTQQIFSNPAQMHYVGDFVTFEMGETPNALSKGYKLNLLTMKSSNATPDAGGGFIMTQGEGKFGFYLGNTSQSLNMLRDLASQAVGAADTFLMQENPFDVFYGAKSGDLNWGASVSFSNSDKKSSDEKQQAMGVRFGVKTDEWAAYANVGLGATAETAGAKYTGKSGAEAGGQYVVDNMKYYGSYATAGASAKTAAGTDAFDLDLNEITVGLTNSWKKDGDLAFYGIAYKISNMNFKKVGSITGLVDGTKVDRTELPVMVGAEVAAAPWLTLRGSLTQNVLLGTTKVSVPSTTAKANSTSHNTTTAAGAGFKWGHNNLDVVMTLGTSAGVNAADFGSQASYTYLF